MNDITGKILGNIIGQKKSKYGSGLINDISKNRMMYSVVARKKISIPDNKIKIVTKNGRKFAVGEYEYKGKKYSAWQATK